MCHHTGFWGGELAGGKGVTAQDHAGHQAVSVALCMSLFVLYILLISIAVVTLHFLCVLLEGPYPNPRVLPFSLHSPSHPGRESGD